VAPHQNSKASLLQSAQALRIQLKSKQRTFCAWWDSPISGIDFFRSSTFSWRRILWYPNIAPATTAPETRAVATVCRWLCLSMLVYFVVGIDFKVAWFWHANNFFWTGPPGNALNFGIKIFRDSSVKFPDWPQTTSLRGSRSVFSNMKNNWVLRPVW